VKQQLAYIAKVAVKYLEYYEKLSQMLERLAEHIVIFDLYTKNSSDEQILHQVGRSDGSSSWIAR